LWKCYEKSETLETFHMKTNMPKWSFWGLKIKRLLMSKQAQLIVYVKCKTRDVMFCTKRFSRALMKSIAVLKFLGQSTEQARKTQIRPVCTIRTTHTFVICVSWITCLMKLIHLLMCHHRSLILRWITPIFLYISVIFTAVCQWEVRTSLIQPMFPAKQVLRDIQGCIQKFPDWPPGVRTANGTALCH